MLSYAEYAPSPMDARGLNLPDRQNWLLVVGRNRDSDCLTESNFACALRDLKGEGDSVEVHRFGHWACGWLEIILVDPSCAETLAMAESIVDSIKEYPILDEDDYSEREMNDANEVWQALYNYSERIRYIRDNRSQFEFRDFSAMLNCCRGHYFAGYASELLS